MRTREEIKSFIITEFVLDGKTEDIPNNLNLFEAGVIDSLGILNLIATLEYEMDIRFEPEDMEAENFASVDRIHALIKSRTDAPI